MKPEGPTHTWRIKRGSSVVVIDADTGAIVRWDVAAEDLADFAPIREGR